MKRIAKCMPGSALSKTSATSSALSTETFRSPPNRWSTSAAAVPAWPYLLRSTHSLSSRTVTGTKAARHRLPPSPWRPAPGRLRRAPGGNIRIRRLHRAASPPPGPRLPYPLGTRARRPGRRFRIHPPAGFRQTRAQDSTTRPPACFRRPADGARQRNPVSCGHNGGERFDHYGPPGGRGQGGLEANPATTGAKARRTAAVSIHRRIGDNVFRCLALALSPNLFHPICAIQGGEISE